MLAHILLDIYPLSADSAYKRVIFDDYDTFVVLITWLGTNKWSRVLYMYVCIYIYIYLNDQEHNWFMKTPWQTLKYASFTN